MSVQTFWLEPTTQVAVGLRRYSTSGHGFDCASGHHQARVFFDDLEEGIIVDGTLQLREAPTPHDDDRWPTTCQACGAYDFTERDHWQDWQDRVWRRTDTNELRTLRPHSETTFNPQAPPAEPGACWDAEWLHPMWQGPDGITLIVRCPDGRDWHVDSRASNCGLPNDTTHKCWIRHGDPRECKLTVDKNGETCNAGAGSIDTGTWHGFLRDGQLA